MNTQKTILAGAALILVSLVLVILSFGQVFPEILSQQVASDYRPGLVTLLAWILVTAAALASLAWAAYSLLDERELKIPAFVLLIWLGGYGWLSLVSPQVEDVYYGWAFDSSYSSITHTDPYGRSTTIDGNTERMLRQLPVRTLRPHGLRVVGFLALLGITSVWIIRES